MTEEIQDSITEVKLTYLNGYLQALAFINSYSPIGMIYKLFSLNFSDTTLIKSIQNNSIQLFDKLPYHYDLKLEQVQDWKKLLMNELSANIDNRAPFVKRNELTYKLIDSITSSYEYFIESLEKEVLGNNYNAYLLNVNTESIYRIVGLDLVFETGNNKIIFLQLLGSD